MLYRDNESARLVRGKDRDGRFEDFYEFDLAPSDVDRCAVIHLNADLFLIEFDLGMFMLFEQCAGILVGLFARNEQQDL